MDALEENFENYHRSKHFSELLPKSYKNFRPPQPKSDLLFPVVNQKHKFFVYSAYHDARTTPQVRVIGATVISGDVEVVCRLWYADHNTTVKGLVKPINPNRAMKHSACFVLCPLSGAIPESVSILAAGSDQPPANKLKVNQDPIDRKDKIAVCVKPFHSMFDNAYDIIEFIELYRILGVSKFTFYNHTVGPKVDCLLRRYMAAGLVDVLPMNIEVFQDEGFLLGSQPYEERMIHNHGTVQYGTVRYNHGTY